MSRAAMVPYITQWSAESGGPGATVIVRPDGTGIAYRDETGYDRDSRGVLWQRVRAARGRGKPEFGTVHELRQRRAMRKLLCQVCAGPADRDGRGVLWLIGDHRDDWPGWPESMGNADPPVCLPCARRAIRRCPFLRQTGWVAVRVQSPRIAGVYGTVYCAVPGRPAAQYVEAATVRFDSPRIHWTVAAQLVMELRDCTIVNLADELRHRSPQSPF